MTIFINLESSIFVNAFEFAARKLSISTESFRTIVPEMKIDGLYFPENNYTKGWFFKEGNN